SSIKKGTTMEDVLPVANLLASAWTEVSNASVMSVLSQDDKMNIAKNIVNVLPSVRLSLFFMIGGFSYG
ncbi:MAG: hypothetical protein ACR2GN_07195, partial [Bacteroidia bacterium]